MGKIYDALEKSKEKRTKSGAFQELSDRAADDKAHRTNAAKKSISLYDEAKLSDVTSKPLKPVESIRLSNKAPGYVKPTLPADIS